ncbi:hypothetical protein ACFCY9_18905 [Streptomyces fimicarius]
MRRRVLKSALAADALSGVVEAANSWAPVGETADPAGHEHVLVEIVTSG